MTSSPSNTFDSAALESALRSTVSTTVQVAKQQFPWFTGCVIALLVLAGLCAVVGSIYFYIYYTRIKARTTSRRSPYAARNRCREPQRSPDGTERQTSTHMFLFKKWNVSAYRTRFKLATVSMNRWRWCESVRMILLTNTSLPVDTNSSNCVV